MNNYEIYKVFKVEKIRMYMHFVLKKSIYIKDGNLEYIIIVTESQYLYNCYLMYIPLKYKERYIDSVKFHDWLYTKLLDDKSLSRIQYKHFNYSDCIATACKDNHRIHKVPPITGNTRYTGKTYCDNIANSIKIEH